MAFREPRTPTTKTPIRRQTMDSGAPRLSFAPTSSAAAQRRSSVFRGTGAPAIFKDKRNLVTPGVKQQMITKITNFLNGELSFDEVKSPTRKNFLFMFEYIYGTLNDNYTTPKSPEEQNSEIIRIFKQIGYPVIIKNSTLQSVNAPTSWPHMLGALGWLCDTVEFYGNIQLQEVFMRGNDSTAQALRYQLYSAVSKEYFDKKRDNMNEEQKMAIINENIQEQFPKYKHRLESYLDVESRVAETRERHKQMEEEIAALEEEKQTDRCPVIQTEIKTYDVDIANLEEFCKGVKENEDRLRKEIEKKQGQIDELNSQLSQLNAVINNKEKQIDLQTERTGLDSAAIRALAMEKETLIAETRQITTELERLSKVKYNMAPKANAAFMQEQSNYRKLVQRVYDVRTTYLEDTNTPLLDAIPKDIKSLLECLSTEVRRLCSRTKTELESRLLDIETNTRRLQSDERRLHDEDARVEKEGKDEEIAMEKEEKTRQIERDEWVREQQFKEREKQSLEVEKETLCGAQKEIGHISRLIGEAELDLEEARKDCTRKRADFDTAMEDRFTAMLQYHEEIQERRGLMEAEVNKLDQFNKERCKMRGLL